jgi:hypothetical protein
MMLLATTGRIGMHNAKRREGLDDNLQQRASVDKVAVF